MSKEMELNLNEKEQLLKDFLNDNFDFKEFKKVGFYSKDIKKTEHQKQANRICQFFGYKTVYEYKFKNNLQLLG